MTTKPSILFILPSFDTTSPRNIRGKNIISHLSVDYDISIFCYKSHKESIVLNNVTIHRRPLSYFFKNIFAPVLCNPRNNKIINFIFRLLRFAGKPFTKPDSFILQNKMSSKYISTKFKKIDIIVASMFPFSSGRLAADLKRNHFPKAKIILDIGDPLSNNSGININKQFAFNYEHSILTEAEHIVVTNTATKAYYNSSFNISKEKISVIPQGVSERFFTTNLSTEKEKKKEKGLSLLYAGIFYPKLRDPSHLIYALTHSSVKHKITFDVYGGNIHTFSRKELKNIINHKRVSNLELINKYKKADILLFFDNAYGIQTSGKIYELISLRKPILFIYDNINSAIVNEFGDFPNIIFCKNTKEELISTLSNLKTHITNLKTSNYPVDLYTWKNRSELFKNIFQIWH